MVWLVVVYVLVFGVMLLMYIFSTYTYRDTGQSIVLDCTTSHKALG